MIAAEGGPGSRGANKDTVSMQLTLEEICDWASDWERGCVSECWAVVQAVEEEVERYAFHHDTIMLAVAWTKPQDYVPSPNTTEVSASTHLILSACPLSVRHHIYCSPGFDMKKAYHWIQGWILAMKVIAPTMTMCSWLSPATHTIAMQH